MIAPESLSQKDRTYLITEILYELDAFPDGIVLYPVLFQNILTLMFEVDPKVYKESNYASTMRSIGIDPIFPTTKKNHDSNIFLNLSTHETRSAFVFNTFLCPNTPWHSLKGPFSSIGITQSLVNLLPLPHNWQNEGTPELDAINLDTAHRQFVANLLHLPAKRLSF